MKKLIKLRESELKNIIENVLYKENSKDFKTELTNIDPSSGQMFWNVKYKTNLDRTYKEIDEAVNRLEDLVKQNKNDKEAIELLNLSKLLRNKFSRYKIKYS